MKRLLPLIPLLFLSCSDEPQESGPVDTTDSNVMIPISGSTGNITDTLLEQEGGTDYHFPDDPGPTVMPEDTLR